MISQDGLVIGLDDECSHESILQAAAMLMLAELPGCRAINTSTVAQRNSGQFQAGVADILVCIEGRFVAIELKSSAAQKGDKALSMWQLRERERIQAAGGHYALCRTLREVLAAVGQ